MWWCRANFKRSNVELNAFQRMLCLGNTGAMKTFRTSAIEVFLQSLHSICSWGLRPEQLLIDSAAVVSGNRNVMVLDSCTWLRAWHREAVLQLWPGKVRPRRVYDKLFTDRFPDRRNGKTVSAVRKSGIVWYKVGSNTNKSTKVGVYGYGTGQKLSFKSWTLYQSISGRSVILTMHVLSRI
jgi:hypothetical protein